jgi:hypothetical protein
MLTVMTSQASADTGSQVIAYGAEFFSHQQANTALDMVARIPGFSLQQGEDVRGLAGAAGNVLIDGERPTTKTDPLENILLRMPVSGVERIDLIIGAAPGIDMQGYPQVINIIRKASKRPNLTSMTAMKIYGQKVVPTQRLVLSKSGTDRSFEAAFLYYGFIDTDENGGERLSYAPGQTPQRLTYDTLGYGEGNELKLSRTQPLWGGKLTLNGLHMVEHFDFDQGFADPDTSAKATETYDNRYEQNELGAQYSRNLGQKLKLELNALWRHHPFAERDAFADDDGRSDFASTSLTLEKLGSATLSYTPTDGQTVRVGYEGAYNSRKSTARYAENGVRIALPSDNVFVEENRSEISAQYIFNPTPAVTLDTGFKYETSTLTEASGARAAKTLTYPKPRVLATFKPNAKTNLRFRFEREVGQLDFDDFVSSVELLGTTVVAGNPDIVPATAWVSELGLEHRWRENAIIDISLTHEAISDAVDRVPIVSSEGIFDAPGNIGDGRYDQLNIALNLPTETYGLKGGVLKVSTHWRTSEVTDPTTFEKRRMSGQNAFSYNVDFRQDVLKRHMAWGLHINNRNDNKTWRVREITHKQQGDWAQLFVEYRPDPKVSVRVEYNNALAPDATRSRTIYEGSRSTGQIKRYEVYTTHSRPLLFMRVLANI